MIPILEQSDSDRAGLYLYGCNFTDDILFGACRFGREYGYYAKDLVVGMDFGGVKRGDFDRFLVPNF